MKKYDQLVFDLDGTLSDSSEGIINAFNYALREISHQQPAGNLKDHIGAPLSETFHRFFPGNNVMAEKGIQLFREYYGRTGKFENQLYPGISELIKDLQKSYPLYVLTNKTQRFAEDILDHFRLSTFFTGIYGLDPVKPTSKTAVALELQKSLFNGNPKLTLLIGDSTYDYECAKNAGWDFCFVTYGFGNASDFENKPTMVAHDPGQLRNLLYAEIFL